MQRPWTAERTVDPDLAAALIEAQCAGLAPGRPEPLGEGWDNTAFLVNGRWVFRFPRRSIAVALMETEITLLPLIAPRLPLAAPVPVHVGAPEPRFPWPFAGYEMIPGRAAARCRLDDRRRADAAEPLAAFLAALHAVPAEDAAAAGAPGDTIRRLDVPYRADRAWERIERAVALGLLADARPWQEVIDAAPHGYVPRTDTVVHGDLDARHVLLDDAARPVGVIDWGDVHVGDAAVDLSIAHGYLPREARERFRLAYGPVDDDAWAVARLRALNTGAMVLIYAHDVQDRALIEESRRTLERLVDG